MVTSRMVTSRMVKTIGNTPILDKLIVKLKFQICYYNFKCYYDSSSSKYFNIVDPYVFVLLFLFDAPGSACKVRGYISD